MISRLADYLSDCCMAIELRRAHPRRADSVRLFVLQRLLAAVEFFE